MHWFHRFIARLRRLFGRQYHTEMGGDMRPSGRLIVKKISEDATEAIRVADSQKRSSAADLSPDGTLSFTITGSSPQGESDVLDVCKMLVSKLNVMGGQWGEPVRPEGRETGIDCMVKGEEGTLNIQVTRAVSDQSIWRQLSQAGTTEFTTTVETAADQLLGRAISKARVPRVQLADTVLAIDAMDAAGYALRVVIENFQLRHGASLRQLGFREVWVVGPLESLTERLAQ